MSNSFLICKKCKVYIQIDTDCGGVSGGTVWEFVKQHTHKRGIRHFKEISCHPASTLLEGYKETNVWGR